MGQTTFSGPVRSLGGFITVGPDTNVSLLASTTLDVPTYSGKLIRLNAAAMTVTLPLINASPDNTPSTPNNIGAIFTFVVETAATAVVIQTQAPDKIVGSAVLQGSSVVAFSTVPATTAKINLNGGTTGGVVGSMFSLQALGAGKWLLRDANLVAAGAPATPFSA